MTDKIECSQDYGTEQSPSLMTLPEARAYKNMGAKLPIKCDPKPSLDMVSKLDEHGFYLFRQTGHVTMSILETMEHSLKIDKKIPYQGHMDCWVDANTFLQSFGWKSSLIELGETILRVEFPEQPGWRVHIPNKYNDGDIFSCLSLIHRTERAIPLEHISKISKWCEIKNLVWCKLRFDLSKPNEHAPEDAPDEPIYREYDVVTAPVKCRDVSHLKRCKKIARNSDKVFACYNCRDVDSKKSGSGWFRYNPTCTLLSQTETTAIFHRVNYIHVAEFDRDSLDPFFCCDKRCTMAFVSEYLDGSMPSCGRSGVMRVLDRVSLNKCTQSELDQLRDFGDYDSIGEYCDLDEDNPRLEDFDMIAEENYASIVNSQTVTTTHGSLEPNETPYRRNTDVPLSYLTIALVPRGEITGLTYKNIPKYFRYLYFAPLVYERPLDSPPCRNPEIKQSHSDLNLPSRHKEDEDGSVTQLHGLAGLKRSREQNSDDSTRNPKSRKFDLTQKECHTDEHPPAVAIPTRPRCDYSVIEKYIR